MKKEHVALIFRLLSDCIMPLSLFGSLFDPEDGSDMFLRNVG
jgi:hypothetical protein